MAFFECEFPRQIRYRRLGSPSGWSTQVNTGFSGQEYRNRNWANSRGKWTIDLMTPSPAQAGSRQSFLQLLIAFHLAVGGKADGFRLKDHTDYQWTAPQMLGTGNGTQTVFQLTNTYSIGSGANARSYVRNIVKPMWGTITDYQGAALPNSVTVALNGTLQAYGSIWTLDPTTGLVTFATAPASGVVVTSPQGMFHYPVRFDSDDLELQTEESYMSGGQPIVSLNSAKLVEVLPPNY
jgi:uncharacterized protein (TIGR02217 family)